jgi:hypothetical protein
MRTISNDGSQPPAATESKKSTKAPMANTYSTKISDGREIVIREMTGRDLVYMEKDLTKAGDVEKGMRIIERLIVGDDKITYDEILDLGVRDFKKLSSLVAEASGAEDDEDPN